ncbi:MAG: hypothetical protein WD872_18840 [Pirellulaceae bacterium]
MLRQHFILKPGATSTPSVGVLALLLNIGLAALAPAQSLDAQFVTGLRARQLFALAERHCTDQLARHDVSQRQQAELVVELIRTRAERAVHAPLAERDARWSQARNTAADFLRSHPEHPRRLLIRLQDGLTPLAHGEQLRLEHDVRPPAAEQRETALGVLREATELLAAIDKELKSEIPLRRRATAKPGELSVDELVAIQQHAQHQLARACRNRALLYAAGSDDRLALLLKAVETLEHTTTQLTPDQPLAEIVQLELAMCQRLLGRFDAARHRLAALDGEALSPTIRLQARAESIRLALAAKELSAVERLLQAERTLGGQASPELDLARLEGMLALAQAASETSAATRVKRYHDQAADLVRLLETAHGPYWGRRADQLLVASVPGLAGGANRDLLARAADTLYLQGRFDEALTAYDRAAGQARAAGDVNVSFDLAYRAALVEQQRQRHAEAARRFRALATELATHPQAPAAHLLAAWHAAQVAEEDAAATEQYAAILTEHLANWPSGESVAQVRLWVGRLAETRHDWQGASDAYAEVPRDSLQASAALAALCAVWRKRVAQPGENDSAANLAGKAIQQLEQAIRDPAGKLPAEWTHGDLAAALTAAQFRLEYQIGKPAEAEALLQAALAGSPDAAPAWTSEAQAQLVVALATQPDKTDEAEALLQNGVAAAPEQLLAVLARLSQAAERSSAATRGQVAQVQLAAVDRLTPLRGQLSAEDVQRLDQLRADALAGAGRRREALAEYVALTRAHPQAGAIQEGYAALLLAGEDAASKRQALAQWRLVASRARPRSERWHLAKYSVALAQWQLGEPAEAATLLRYLLETPPRISDPAWQDKFVALLKQCSP